MLIFCMDKLISDLAFIGLQLNETYSEVNTNSADGLIQAKNIVVSWEEKIKLNELDEVFLSEIDKDGILKLLDYLNKKIIRRLKAVDGFSVNF